MKITGRVALNVAMLVAKALPGGTPIGAIVSLLQGLKEPEQELTPDSVKAEYEAGLKESDDLKHKIDHLQGES